MKTKKESFKISTISKKSDHKSRETASKTVSCQPIIVYNNVSQTHPALEKYLGYLLHRIQTSYRSKLDQRFSSLKFQGHHFAVLSIITQTPTITHNQISEETGIDKASMVKIIDHLEKLKLITRKESPIDRRVKNITATQKGVKVQKQASDDRMDFEKDFLNVLSEDEKKHFKDTLLKLIKSQKNQ
ncbi:MAG: MarR family winged helix-turn-helix transcriptional regulator [Pseudobdellovibrio sp.]